ERCGHSALFATRRQLCQKLSTRAAQLARVRHDVARYRQAIPSGSVSEQVLQNAEDQMAGLEAEWREAVAELRSVEAKVEGTDRVAHPEVEAAKQRYVEAYLEFSRQQIRAPVSGYVAQRKAQVGDRVHPGELLLVLVPLDHLWVEANLRETEMKRVRPGQTAEVSVDLYGTRHRYRGTVEGIMPGTGSVFALLRPTTPPATSSTSSSVCRCESPCIGTTYSSNRCGPAFPPSHPSAWTKRGCRPTTPSPRRAARNTPPTCSTA
ncbi:HlyD family secretion protein, partial [Methylogaea oryzae]|uniref:HlyD family secretion protein n=1 Tax=Methylogaea oryzae TaxID=1295382 RepID=UPI0020D01023